MRRRLRAVATVPSALILALIAAGGLVLRLNNNDYGLPFVYNVDEGSHFTNRAVEMFGGDWNPGYFQNPSGFTYLTHLVLRIGAGDHAALVEDYKLNPTDIYVQARSLAAVLCMLGAVALFFVGRRLWNETVGLVAAAVLSFAFLPVAYSRIAVTDVGTLLPVALALYGAARVREEGRTAHWALAGAATGLAVGFKYTAGLVGLALVVAGLPWLLRAWREQAPRAGVALACAVAAFFLTTPYFLLDMGTAFDQLADQAERAGDVPKPGQEDESGIGFYLGSLGWGLGWLAALAALCGAVIEVRRDRLRGILLLAFPLALFLYLSTQSRFFGRWLLPAYPVAALLAGVAVAQAAALVRRRGPLAAAGAAAGLTLVILAQPLAADIRTSRVLGHTDTRTQARRWLANNYPPSLRIVIEPSVPPTRYYRRRSPDALGRKLFVRGFNTERGDEYTAALGPGTIDAYRRTGFCLVMTFSTVRGRAAGDRDALAYYDRLERDGELIKSFSPYHPGADPVPLNFDLSFNYHPSAYRRPGPDVRIYRLKGCKQRFGPLRKVRPA